MSTIEAARKALDELAALPPNWDSYGAKPITTEAIEAVRRYLDRFALMKLDTMPTHVAPLPTGGVTLEIFTGLSVEASVDFGPDGESINDG